MTEYTPTTDVVRDRYGIEAGYARLIHAEDALPEFDRWLAAHDAEVARAARVLPSVEAAAEAACRAAHPTRWEYRATSSPCDGCRHGARAVLTLFADAPSREQVEREAAEKALREAADEIDLRTYYPVPGMSELHNAEGAAGSWLHARADRLAEGGEA